MADRYSRQIILPGVGLAGQKALQSGRVLCVGVGGLGSPAALYLASAGVGTLGLIDSDQVEESNLQRQILFGTSDLGKSKALAAQSRLKDLNPGIQLQTFAKKLEAQNALEIVSQFDVLIDGTDNFSAKFLLNDVAAKLGKPVVYGAISQFEGQISVFWKGHGPCYRCLYPVPPQSEIRNCAEAGVLGSLAGIIGSMQATEAVKLLLRQSGLGLDLKPLMGRLFVIDVAGFQSHEFQLQIRLNCSICHATPEEILLSDLEESCDRVKEWDLLSSLFMDVREIHEWEKGHIPGALHWPFSRLMAGELPTRWDDSKLLVLYCQTESRAKRALALLHQSGIHKATYLKGGFSRWKSSLVE